MSTWTGKLIVNGEARAVTAHPDTPLLWVLRDLDDYSAKFGCGLGQCGACRVLVDGLCRFSCHVPVGELGDADVRDDPAAIAGQGVLMAHNAGQCGYCLPGIVVTLVNLARRGERLSEDDIRLALDDHLCRCGSQPRILRAAFDVLAAHD